MTDFSRAFGVPDLIHCQQNFEIPTFRILQSYPAIQLTYHLQFHARTPAIKNWSRVRECSRFSGQTVEGYIGGEWRYGPDNLNDPLWPKVDTRKHTRIFWICSHLELPYQMDGLDHRLMWPCSRWPQNSVYRRSDGAASWSHVTVSEVKRTSSILFITP